MVIDPLGPFGREVISDNGRVDAEKLAIAMDLTLSELAPILGVTPTSLTESPTDRVIQEQATKLLTMLDELALYLQEKRYARYWLRTPQRELGNYTALDWLMKGKLDDVFDHVVRMVNFTPD
jgi:hypothetical protein